jgi:hypothetical protein
MSSSGGASRTNVSNASGLTNAFAAAGDRITGRKNSRYKNRKSTRY